MNGRLIVCGLNGSGKSTLGRALAAALGCPFLDVETYWFGEPAGGYNYARPRTREEVEALLTRDLRENPSCVLAAVTADYGAEAEALLDRAIFLHVPREIRMQRIRDRSFRKFGARMLPGGDLHASEERFFAMCASREEAYVTAWLQKVGLPVIHLDGTADVGENVEKAKGLL